MKKPAIILHHKKHFWYKTVLCIMSGIMIFFGLYHVIRISYDTFCLYQLHKRMTAPMKTLQGQENKNVIQTIKKNITDYIQLKRKYERILTHPYQLFHWYYLLYTTLHDQAVIEQLMITKHAISCSFYAPNMSAIFTLTTALSNLEFCSQLTIKSCQKMSDGAILCTIIITPKKGIK